LLKREKRLIAKNVALDKNIAARINAMQDSSKVAERDERKKVGLDAPRHLYDIGRSRNTEFDPHMTSDR
jgi:hypothetical protein